MPKGERAEKRPPTSGRPRAVPRKPDLRARASRALPGSVIATKWRPAASAPTRRGEPRMDQLEEGIGLDRRARLRGDEEEACSGAMRVEEGLDRRRARSCRGHGARRRRPAEAGRSFQVRPSTSGQSDEPPIPSTTAVVRGVGSDRFAKRAFADHFLRWRRRQIEPSEPARLVGIREDRGIAFAQPKQCGTRAPSGADAALRPRPHARRARSDHLAPSARPRPAGASSRPNGAARRRRR